MSKKNIIVGQSGGPTAVINSSLYGVVTEGLRNKDKVDKVYGMLNGIEGFLKGNMIDFEKDLSKSDLELLTTTPAA
ncbi:MAG: 6-phosphofructokinase, partial [Clostridiales bacterium]|nr:6-phosphofructokinase [Clostridiales bacterium]